MNKELATLRELIGSYFDGPRNKYSEALAILDRLQAQESREDEPVAWAIEVGENRWIYTSQKGLVGEHELLGSNIVPLYTSKQALSAADERAVLRDGVRVFLGAARDYMSAVAMLGTIVEGKTLFEHSPTKRQDCFDAWVSLNDTGRKLTEVCDSLDRVKPTEQAP